MVEVIPMVDHDGRMLSWSERVPHMHEVRGSNPLITPTASTNHRDTAQLKQLKVESVKLKA